MAPSTQVWVVGLPVDWTHLLPRREWGHHHHLRMCVVCRAGDCYLVLDSKRDAVTKQLKHSIHFWLGKDATQVWVWASRLPPPPCEEQLCRRACICTHASSKAKASTTTAEGMHACTHVPRTRTSCADRSCKRAHAQPTRLVIRVMRAQRAAMHARTHRSPGRVSTRGGRVGRSTSP